MFLLSLAMSMVISMVVIPIMWRMAPNLGMLDEPDPRKVHLQPTPRIGGFGIVIGALLPILLLTPNNALMQSYLLGAVILLFFGAWDDACDIGHFAKIIGQLLAVLVVVLFGKCWIIKFPFINGELPPSIAVPLTIFALVGMINAMNTSDGLDGLAGGESFISLLAIAALAYTVDGYAVMVIAISTVGGILGLLRYNTYPAQVFMGDTGSQFLGYTLGFLAIVLTQQTYPSLSPASTLLFLGLPIIDIFLAVLRRRHKGVKWYLADKSHIHHRLLAIGFDHYETVVFIYLIHAILVTAALLVHHESDLLILIFYFGMTGTIAWLLQQYEKGVRHIRSERRLGRITSTLMLLRNKKLYQYFRLYLMVTIPVYIIFIDLFYVKHVPNDFAVVAIVAVIAVLCGMLSISGWLSEYLIRGGIYGTVLFTVFLSIYMSDDYNEWLSFIIFIHFVILAAIIWLTIRQKNDAIFKSTPTDYLIMSVVLIIGFFGNTYMKSPEAGKFLIHSLILLYGCEIIIDKFNSKWNGLSVCMIFALSIISIKGLAVL